MNSSNQATSTINLIIIIMATLSFLVFVHVLDSQLKDAQRRIAILEQRYR